MYKPINKDEVLRLVQTRGPVIPNHIRKELDTDTVMVGAVLSQLISEGKLKVTTVKIGGSPNYYAPGSEAKLVDLIKYLNEKDRRVAEMLMDQKVMKDSDQDPLVRVSLRNIKDYAKPLEVTIKGKVEVYWKWFLLSAQEAEDLLAQQINPKKPEKPVVKAPEKVPEVKEDITTAAASNKDSKAEATGKSIPAAGKKEKVVDSKKETTPAAAVVAPKETASPKAAASTEEKSKPEEKKGFFERVKESIIPSKQPEEKKPKAKKEKPQKDEPAVTQAVPVEFHFSTQQRLPKPGMLLDEERDTFFLEVRNYLESFEVAILDFKIVKKGEIDLSILVPTKLGSQEYFCKAKNKKKIAEGDLSSAYLQGQQTKLPIVFLSPGDVNKKTKETMHTQFKGMVVKKL